MKRSARALSVALLGVLALDCSLAEQSAAQCPSPVQRTQIQRDVQEPGVYGVGRAPAEYGWVTDSNGERRRVLLRPYKNQAQFQPPAISWNREHLSIQPEDSEFLEHSAGILAPGVLSRPPLKVPRRAD